MATEEKYDRQLRLWGANGQRALSECRILLVNAHSAAGTETLKNLVLPGIGSFCVIGEDSHEDAAAPVSAGDGAEEKKWEELNCPSNFFSVPGGESGQKTQAEVTFHYLQELNEDVKGHWRSVPSLDALDYSQLLVEEAQRCRDVQRGVSTVTNTDMPTTKKTKVTEDASITNTSSTEEEVDQAPLLVIAADLPLGALLSLSSACWKRQVPLLCVKSYGLVGTVRIQVERHPIVESRPDPQLPDLRLYAIWDDNGTFPLASKLLHLANNVIGDLDALNDKDHGHVPYVIVLIHAMQRYKKQNSTTAAPKTRAEKESFKKLVKSMARNYQDELNFQEAYKNAHLAYSPRDIPYEVQQLMEEQTSQENVKTLFDALILALQQFMKAQTSTTTNHAQLPLNGSIPDMTSDTSTFIKLQGIYKECADTNVQSMRGLVDDICSKAKLPIISEEELSIFCKNVYNLQLLATRSIHEEVSPLLGLADGGGGTSPMDVDGEESPSIDQAEWREELAMACMDPADPPEHTPLLWYLSALACDVFESRRGRYPGQDLTDCPDDTEAVWTILQQITKHYGVSETELVQASFSKEKQATELVRWGNAELHTVASVVGGVASQEAVKLVTKQFVPVQSLYVFNGIASIGGVYRV